MHPRRLIAEVEHEAHAVIARDLFYPERVATLDDAPPPGTLVEIELPTDPDAPARILATLAPPRSARAELYRILVELDLDPTFPHQIDAEVERHLASPGFDDPTLEDLTALTFVTIDNEDSRDLDQAMHLAQRPEGAGYDVLYALADASFYVRPGSALFTEALRRGTSFYLPRLSVPMLPRQLSEGLISLNPDEPRRALILHTTLDPEGHIEATRVRRALIRSRAKLSYKGVQRYHDDPDTSPLAGQPYTPVLDLLATIGRLRIQIARARHVVSYDRCYIDVQLGDDGYTFTATTATRNDVERWNEQLSLLCNMEAARLLAEATDAPHVQPIYRVHPAPSEAALHALSRTIDAIVEAHHLDPDAWCWRRHDDPDTPGESLADYIERLPDDPASRRPRAAIEHQAMIAASASSYSPDLGPHWGLGAPGYVRLSAPMREIVGIFTHKELLERLAPPELATPNAIDEQLRETIVNAANAARNTQRRLTKRANKLVIDHLLERELRLPEHERPWRTGTILGLSATRLYVQLDDPPIEVKVYTHHLDEQLRPDHDRVALTSPRHNLRVGDGVVVQTHAYDPAEGHWHFTLKPIDAHSNS